MVVDRREVCEHVRKSVFVFNNNKGPVLHKLYGTKWPLYADVPLSNHSFILTERLTQGDFQGCAAHALILESALRHSYEINFNFSL